MRLAIIVEGETELDFVNKILIPYFSNLCYLDKPTRRVISSQTISPAPYKHHYGYLF